MSQWLIRDTLQPGLNEVRRADPEREELIDFYLWRAEKTGESIDIETEGKEFAVVILSGLVDLTCGRQVFHELGGRTSVFAGRATGAYVPPGLTVRIEALSPCEVALCAAPSEAQGGPQIVTPSEVVVKTVGNWNWQRDVHTVIGDNVKHAQRLVVGETYNLPGNWSSYPPHKHTEDNYPFEVRMEEIYHFRVNPEQGFGIQCLFDDEYAIDVAYIVRDGDTVIIPSAYHPVVAAPGYQVYYLWMLAGYTDRRMRPNDDPRHAWVHAAGQMARGMGF
ncbi:MAG: 5-deoxy-glucuronate isomerase [Armatimonadetes bacterium]|nr:5-deoxy-glucuronate isomerase [Armatimonadota bacterium]